VQPQDARRPLEGAEHHDDTAVLAHVGDRLGAAAVRVQVRHGVVVEHAQAADRSLRRHVDVSVLVERRRAHEEQRLPRDPVAVGVLDALEQRRHHLRA
jgi:hypothetical protein